MAKIFRTLATTLAVFAFVAVGAATPASAAAVQEEKGFSTQTVKEARFTNHKTSVTQLGARHDKKGKIKLVNKGGKAQKGTRYVVVFPNTEAWYRGIDGRATGPVWQKLEHGTHRVIVTRTYIVKWDTRGN